MKWLLLALLALVASVAIALAALPDPGYVLLGYGKYSVETSLLVLLVVLGLLYLGLRLLAGVWQVPAKVQRWESKRHNLRLQRLFDGAVIDLTEGRVERAERRLARVIKSRQAPLQAYLSAARVAGQSGADERCDTYLELARQRNPGAEITIALTRAEILLTASKLEQAQTVLSRLHNSAPRNNQVLRLLMQLYVQQQDWKQLRDLLPELRRSQVLNDHQWQQLAVKVYRERVLALSSDRDLETLKEGWKQLPPPVQQDEGLLAVYIEQLVHLGEHEQAEQLLGARIREGWNPRLVYLYGDLQSVDVSAQQALAEHWLEQHRQDPVLLLSLAKISLRNQLWGKARSYLEASIDLQPGAEAYRLLGALLEQLEEPDKAADCYRKGVELLGQGMSGIVLPAPDGESTQSINVIPISRSA
ncbi:MAG: heme biosynthesis protein HemY [Gammaproteobacteria bacterium]|nr:MAG: heme biosynthesis protein HemY [Gammaproteobacteria bacterium]